VDSPFVEDGQDVADLSFSVFRARGT